MKWKYNWVNKTFHRDEPVNFLGRSVDTVTEEAMEALLGHGLVSARDIDYFDHGDFAKTRFPEGAEL